MKIKIGFMQGRLVDSERKKRIQYFPAKNWENEIKIAKKNRLDLMEWTVDNENIDKNPLYNKKLFSKYKIIKKKYKFSIPSLTCDFFMYEPFFKLKNKKKKNSIYKLKRIIKNGIKLGIKIFVIPLVDRSSVKNLNQLNDIIEFFSSKNFIKILTKKVKVVFETDFKPIENHKFIKKLNKEYFGINYDTGNSASLGFDFNKEKIFFSRVYNIHIKDRCYRGSSVRLGNGDFNFNIFFQYLKKINYKGNLIMQTARSSRKRHIEEILINKKFIEKFL